MLNRVLVAGTGVIGTSVALALRRHGIEVRLTDRSSEVVTQAVQLGAGELLRDHEPPADVAIVAVPPSEVAGVLVDLQQARAARTYTDVASVKGSVVEQARRRGCDMTTFVPGHPLAGSHRRGPAAANVEMFTGRPWALCPMWASESAVHDVMHTVELTGALPCVTLPGLHDQAVAVSSHAPHVVSSLLAALFDDPDLLAPRLSGQGLLDTTRIAAGPAELWTDILTSNASAVSIVLDELAAELASCATRLRAAAARPTSEHAYALRVMLERGTRGRDAIAARERAKPSSEMRRPFPRQKIRRTHQT